MTRNRTLRAAALVAACIMAQSCSLLSPVPDRSRFFTLPVPPEPQSTRAAATPARPDGAAVYGLGPIVLPSYLDRREVATRVSPTEIKYSNTDRWAAPLTADVASVLLHALSDELGTSTVVAYPWPVTARPDYQIAVTLLRFERDTTGAGHLAAAWSVRDVQSGRELVANHTVVARAGSPDDAQATAAALSGTLSDLSREIAAALHALPAARAAPARRRS
jgi:uncharacterized lipoprotein YmbA